MRSNMSAKGERTSGIKQYINALAIFAGTAIGVGIFGLPYATAKFGFFPTMVYFVICGAITLIIQLAYGEICLRTTELHRMPGYAQLYLGSKAKFFILVSNAIGLYAALLAYIIIGGEFLGNLLMPVLGGNEITYLLAYFAAGAVLIYLGANTVANSTLITLSIFIVILTLLAYYAWPNINPQNYLTVNLTNWIIPYGIILFSLSAVTVIPDVKEVLGQHTKKLKNIIISGTGITIFFSIIFILLITGVTGSQTTPDALNGLENVLGHKVLLAGFIFGIIVIFDSYLAIGLSLKKIFQYDLKIPHFYSWVLATFIPLILYFLGVQNFIIIISFSAATTALVEGTIIYLMYLKAKSTGQRTPEYALAFNKILLYPLIFLLVVGVGATLMNLI